MLFSAIARLYCGLNKRYFIYLSIVTFPAKSEIQRVFCILPDQRKSEKKNNPSEGAENIDFAY